MQIRKLVLQTSYLETLKEFYSSILELPVQVMNEEQILIKVGATDLIFSETTTGEPFYHFAINIPSNKIEEAKAWLNKKVKLMWIEDYNSDIADFVNWHAKSVYFYDPAGNILELISRFDLNNKSRRSFSSQQFLSISEVGVVFKQDEFDQRSEELKNGYSLHYFSKQPPLQQFRAIGDDEGLFVVVPENRNWYPTDKPSGIFPIAVEFDDNKENYQLQIPQLYTF
jgi:hypothetical protein